jgi:hypothetical protein
MSETYPPEDDMGRGAPPEPDAISGPPAPGDVPGRHKQKVHKGYAVLGFFTPWLVSAVFGFASSVFSNFYDLFNGLLPVISASALGIGVFVGMLLAFLIGRRRGDNRLRSFGLGGLIAYAATVLFSLLAFGACFVLLGQVGN